MKTVKKTMKPIALKQSFDQILKTKSASVVAGLSISLLTISSVEALNIGEARSQSFLGQPLSIFVPVSDTAEIVDLNQLIVSVPNESQLTELNLATPSNNLDYQVVARGNEKGILITTSSPFNEPFINVGVKVDYKGVTKLRKLTALIDLQPSSTLTNSSELSSSPVIPNTSVSEAVVIPNTTNRSSSNSTNSGAVTYSNEIMGPYDWAQAGAIPKKFGPVLEGQSLWRVARRINESMNVSIDQMMWALFRANPQAFIGNDVESLQAGSILTIPEESFVREATELGAVRLLNTAKKEQVVSVNAEQTPDTGVVSPVQNSIESDSSTSAALNANEGTVNSTQVSEQQLATETVASDAATKTPVVSVSQINTINELKGEVAYLNQQLAAQEQRIIILEDRLAISESLRNGSDSSNSIVSESVNEGVVAAPDSSEIAQIEPSNSIVVPAATPIDDGSSVSNVESESSSIASSQLPSQTEAAASVTGISPVNNPTGFSGWIFAGIALLVLGLGYLSYIGRHKLIPALLKVFGNRYEYDDEAPLSEAISKKRRTLRDLSQIQKEKTQAQPNGEELAQQEVQEVKDDFEDYSFFVDDEELMDVEEFSFPDRIKQLIDSGDYDEARKTVTFASVANVSEDDINLYLLKIFAAEADEESFNKLFDKVHANIESYDEETQMVIAELQSEMAIGKVINFQSDKIAS